ncbi:putative major facilitator superfamily, MFS transporter superfamily [Septoria linicola]|nr:putative major facilitator superfamily, MFS transporter superfamily [Septoria linicola]
MPISSNEHQPLLSSPHPSSASPIHRFIRSTGLLTVLHSPRDIKLILLCRFIRIFAFGLVSLLLAAYLLALGYSETRIGLFFFLTLLGDLIIVMVLTQIADVVGRKNVLMLGAGSMATVAVTYIPAAILISLYGIVPHHPQHLPFFVPIILLQAFFEPIYIAPRNAFIGRIINKQKRTAIFGVINMVKIVSNATGSFFTGLCADRNLFWVAFVVAGGLKVVYVVALLWTFLGEDRRLEGEVRRLREGGEEERGQEEQH